MTLNDRGWPLLPSRSNLRLVPGRRSSIIQRQPGTAQLALASIQLSLWYCRLSPRCTWLCLAPTRALSSSRCFSSWLCQSQSADQTQNLPLSTPSSPKDTARESSLTALKPTSKVLPTKEPCALSSSAQRLFGSDMDSTSGCEWSAFGKR